MDNATVSRLLGGVPFMTLEQADRLTAFMAEQGVKHVLELGFAHGVSTCYMAAALARNGGGSIVTMDLASSRGQQPNIEELLERIGERGRVRVHFEPTSYTWRLMKMLEEDPRPRFDFCYLDGAHSWFVDGFAFFLVDRLLEPGGWIVFDDLDWSYAASPSLSGTEWVRAMPPDERDAPQVRKIFDLLVVPHPNYRGFRIADGWGYAQKRPEGPAGPPEVRTVTQVERVYVGPGGVALRAVERLRRALSRSRFRADAARLSSSDGRPPSPPGPPDG